MKKLIVAINAILSFSLLIAAPAMAEQIKSAEQTQSASTKAVVKASKKSPARSDEEKLIARFKEKYPATQVSSVSKSPIPGVFEVVMGSNVAYTDMNAKFLFIGHIIDMSTQTDLTQARIDDMSKIDFSSLPLDKAIKVVKGNGMRTFAVFTDPDCPFCKRLEEGLKDVDNYTMYVFMFPIAQLHPEAEAHATAIWCATDKVVAWKEYMLQGKLPASKGDCENPIRDLVNLGQQMGIQGTPTLFRADGARVPGFMPAPQMNAWLDGKKVGR